MTTVLARLAPKSQIPNGEGHGGHAKLEQCDVAYALGGLRAGPAALLRAVYVREHDESNMRALTTWAWVESMRIAVESKWDIPKGRELLRKMSAAAVYFAVYPKSRKCPNCGGTGSVQPNQHNPTGDCGKCGKTGLATFTAEQMADVVGVSPKEWEQVWGPRFARIEAFIGEWHGIGLRHVRMRLQDE